MVKHYHKLKNGKIKILKYPDQHLFTLWLSTPYKRALEQAAQDRGIKQCELVREAIIPFIQNHLPRIETL